MAAKKYDSVFSEEDKEKMRQDYLSGISIRDVMKKYNVSCNAWLCKKVLNGITRTASEASKIAHKNCPENYFHTEETKQKIRVARLNFMKQHPEETAWRKRNEPSYPEKCFIKFLIENGYDKNFLIEREKSVFPFYIDFAFTNIKLAVEIDGSQHVYNSERVERDKLKEVALKKEGWRVLRISENLVKTDWATLKEELDNAIGNDFQRTVKVGIFKEPQKSVYKKVARGKDGLTAKMRENNFNQRKVKNRPSYQELLNLKKSKSNVEIGNMFNVSEAAIRKWIKQYEKFRSLV